MVAVQRNLDNYNKPLYNKVICITSGNLHPTTSNGTCKTFGKEPQYNKGAKKVSCKACHSGKL